MPKKEMAFSVVLMATSSGFMFRYEDTISSVTGRLEGSFR